MDFRTFFHEFNLSAELSLSAGIVLVLINIHIQAIRR